MRRPAATQQPATSSRAAASSTPVTGGQTPGATGSGTPATSSRAAASSTPVAGGQTPGATGRGEGGPADADNWHRQQGEWQQKSARNHVSFADVVSSCVEIERAEEGVQGTVEPHLPPIKSFSTFLALVLDGGLEADPILPGIRSWCHETIDGYATVLLGNPNVPVNFFLGVCVTCPPYATDVLVVTLPILLAQLIPYLGRVRVHVLLPEGNDAILMWAMTGLEFHIRLQVLRIYVAQGGSHYHDAVWRNAVASAAISDGATCARNLVDTWGDRRSVRIWIILDRFRCSLVQASPGQEVHARFQSLLRSCT